MADLNVEIITPSKIAFRGSAKSVTIPGTAGSFQVLYNHAPILSTFEIGVVKVLLTDDKASFYATGGGTVEVLKNNVRILADSLEAIDEIDVERAKNAKERAESRINKSGEEKIDRERAKKSLERADNRIKIFNKYFNQN